MKKAKPPCVGASPFFTICTIRASCRHSDPFTQSEQHRQCAHFRSFYAVGAAQAMRTFPILLYCRSSVVVGNGVILPVLVDTCLNSLPGIQQVADGCIVVQVIDQDGNIFAHIR